MPLTSLTSTINPSQLNKNYIPNGQLETNSTAGWSLFTTTLTSGLPTGTLSAGASSLSLSTTSTSPLFQTYSLLLTGSGAVTAGQGLMSDPFTIDRVDLAKPLTFRIYYEAISGATNANWSGIVGSQSFAVYLYDVTNSAWVQPAGAFGMNQSAGPAYVTGTFQTSSTAGQQYRLVLMCLQATTGAISLEIDEVSVTPQTAPIGAVATDWIPYSPTFTGGTPTNSVLNGRWRRVGDSMEIQGSLEFSGTPSAFSTVLISLPSGAVIDTAKLPLVTIGGFRANLGYGTIRDDATASYSASVQYQSNTVVEVMRQAIFTAPAAIQNGSIGSTTPITFGANDCIEWSAVVPIAGWGSNVQLSNDTDTRVVCANVNTSTTSIGTSDTLVVFTNVVNDTHGAYSTSTGRYTVPVSGFYKVTSFLTITSLTLTTGQSFASSVYLDGVLAKPLSVIIGNGASNAYRTFGSAVVYANAGQLLDVRAFNSSTSTPLTSVTITNNNASFERLSGPSVVAATESVNASYWVSTNFTASPTVPINFDAKEFDSHNAVTPSLTAWKFTAPISGIYQVSAVLNWTTATTSYVHIYKNGSIYKALGTYNVVNAVQGVGSTDLRLNAGEYIDIRVGPSSTAQGGALNAGSATSNISIKRVGN